MRVISGTRRSIPLKPVPGNDTRPTTDRIKETLFNMLGPYIPGSRFLDLFAGSGGIGIEALSRGASFACFIERSGAACSIISQNLAKTRFEEDSLLIKGDVLKCLGRAPQREPYDIIFMDPPYDKGLEKQVMCAASHEGWFAKDAIFVAEASKETDFSWLAEAGYEVLKDKIYKTNRHIFCRKVL